MPFNRMYRYTRIGCPAPRFRARHTGGGKQRLFTGVARRAGAQLCPSARLGRHTPCPRKPRGENGRWDEEAPREGAPGEPAENTYPGF